MDIKLACTHQNSLTYWYGEGRCDVCGEEISHLSYNCRRCNVWLHESCANKLQHLPLEIIHPLHSHHQLKLQLHRPLDFFCDKCSYISTGSRYNCSSCEFILDLKCASSVNDPLPEEEWRSFKDREKKTILHYSHSHLLILFKYRKIKEDDYNCSWCDKRLLDSDVCYGCIECEFFLHEVCTDKIPRTFRHPFHPSHPFRLHYREGTDDCHACGESLFLRVLDSPLYGCQMCKINVHFRCAKLLPTLKHKCHDHLLTYFGKIYTDFQREHFECKICKMLCDANFYRCVQCGFNFHLQCLQIPSSATHKYHRHQLILMDSVKEDDSEEYYCDVCEEERNPNHPVYCCKKCTYIVHIECVLHEGLARQSMDSKVLIVKEMEHNDDIHDTSQQPSFLPAIHDCPYTYVIAENLKGKRYCVGCRLVLGGLSYFCRNCPWYHLHEKCSKLQYEIQHPFHSNHPLNLYLRYPPDIDMFSICDECRDISRGFIYLCEECNFKLDVKCVFSEVSQVKKMERVTELYHFTHPHKLILGNSSDPIDEILCTICELPILGPAYFCPNCRYIIHGSCLGLPQKMQVPFHLDHMLVISHVSYTQELRCYACPMGFDNLKFAYSCEQCDVKLHSVCANSLRRPLKCESHNHNLYYFGTSSQSLFAKYKYVPDSLFHCSECQKNCRGHPFYRCLECAINFHLECVPIPQIVKSRCHIHPLVMKDSFVEDDSGEYYCDVCEEERCGNDHVYCCEECNNLFIAHIECILAKEEKVISLEKGVVSS
ncbi:hypothetical protein CRYUN_Cryun09bG0197300 [Craigia yunnanensis]